MGVGVRATTAETLRNKHAANRKQKDFGGQSNFCWRCDREQGAAHQGRERGGERESGEERFACLHVLALCLFCLLRLWIRLAHRFNRQHRQAKREKTATTTTTTGKTTAKTNRKREWTKLAVGWKGERRG
jgi:hypothetical protein